MMLTGISNIYNTYTSPDFYAGLHASNTFSGEKPAETADPPMPSQWILTKK